MPIGAIKQNCIKCGKQTNPVWVRNGFNPEFSYWYTPIYCNGICAGVKQDFLNNDNSLRIQNVDN